MAGWAPEAAGALSAGAAAGNGVTSVAGAGAGVMAAGAEVVGLPPCMR